MRIAGIILLTLGTIVGSVGGAKLPQAHVPTVVVGAVLLIAGVIAFRIAARAQRAQGESASGDVLQQLRELASRLETLEQEASSLSLHDLVERLTVLETELMAPIGEATDALMARLGGKQFANVYGAYSSGERFLRRAWSAAADGHQPEALRSLDTGVKRVQEAVASLQQGA